MIEPIRFDQMDQWKLSDASGCIEHDSGQFFRIQGLRICEADPNKIRWEQPIIIQDEIGILGLLVKKIDGILHFLVQAKIEPGNINLVQISPTLQATRSNFLRVHGGRAPNYLEFFRDASLQQTRFDQFQSEQGTRFLDKLNRNIIVEIEPYHDIEVLDDYCWMTLGQIKQLGREDNLLNMDLRSVLSGLDFFVDSSVSKMPLEHGTFGDRILSSMSPEAYAEHDNAEILAWISRNRFDLHFHLAPISLKNISGWSYSPHTISSEDHNFSVIATHVEIDNREVATWTQPMMRQCEAELFGFVAQRRQGVLHFLCQLMPEVGLRKKAEIGPTVQCCPMRRLPGEPEHARAYLDLILSAERHQRKVDVLQSEEGGRFYHEQNRNVIVEIEEGFPLDPDENFRWLNLAQIHALLKHPNYLNIQARSVLSLLDINAT